jgi:hypothetical protein
MAPPEWVEDPDWSETEIRLFEDMAHDTDALEDPHLQALFDTAFFNFDVSKETRKGAREALNDYVKEVYDFDFDTWFDWAAWREMYGE